MKEDYAWSEDDHILTYYLYRYNDTFLPIEYIMEYQCMRFRLEELGCQECTLEDRRDSIKMRVSNFSSLESGKGLYKVSRMTKRVYKEWKDRSQTEHKAKCEEILKQASLYHLFYSTF